MGDYAPGVEFEEVVAALDIPSEAERQLIERPGLHVVVPVFMGIDVLSKIEEAMFGEIGGLACNLGLWDKPSIDAVLVREYVEPEHHGINELAHEDTWDADV